MKIYMFPGQGSQYKGMGGELFDRFKDLTAQADSILGYSVKRLCLEDPDNQLHNTRFTQPALFVVNALSHAKKMEESKAQPDFVVGHSLGEFNALLAAGCFDFATGLKLVQRRGQLMGEVTNGGMAAVLNATRETIEERLAANGLANVHLANYNTPSQIVLSGVVDEIAKAEMVFQGGTLRYYPLATSGAFHSPFMREAMVKFKEYLAQFNFAAPKIPVIANVTARPYAGNDILETLSSQIASTVRWCESIQYLLAVAASRGDTAEFEELAQGDVLTKMVYTIKAQTPQDVLDRCIAELKPAPQPSAADIIVDTVPATAQDKVAAWNKRFAVGTKVKSSIADYDQLETRTEAMVLFGHRAAVYMKGFNGYFDLDELTPA
jgi:malonyl CoA-acyl carrier protein transacylase